MKTLSFFDFMNQKKPLSHITFLLLSLAFVGFIFLTGKIDHSFTSLSGAFILLFLQLEAFIFFGNILFSRMNFDQSPGVVTRTIILRFTIFIVTCFLVAMLLFLLLQYAILIIKGLNVSDVLFNFIHAGFRPWFRSVVSGLSGGAVVFVILLWQASLRREQKLREENLIFQNQTLKAQVNPHFLFNCLNTLSSLIITRPDTAERFIARLSHIYRYITENSTRDKVSLENELEFIHDYFFLYQIRDEDKIILDDSVQENAKYYILPVSLQVLVENAIKHNMATREKPLVIKIFLEDDMIVVKNNLQKMSATLKSTGTGLRNLSERIRLLTGKEILINESQNEFAVKMPLMV